MSQRDLVGYVHPKNCPTREQETKVDFISGVSDEKRSDNRPKADIAAEIALDEAYQRRGTAAQVGGVMSFKYHEMIRRFLMEALRMTPHRNDLHAPNFEDIIACDKEIWHRLSTEVESLKMEEDSFYMPLDWYVEDILNHPQITQMLAPRLGAARGTKRPTQEWEAPKEKGGGQQTGSKAGTPGPNHARNVARKTKSKDNKKKAGAELGAYREAAGKKGKDKGEGKGAKGGKDKGAKGGKGKGAK